MPLTPGRPRLNWHLPKNRIHTPTAFPEEAEMIGKKKLRTRKMRCRFCTKEGCPRPAFVDYKDTNNLKKLVSNQGKLFGRKRSQLCAPFQRAVSNAVKRARTMALLPYVGE